MKKALAKKVLDAVPEFLSEKNRTTALILAAGNSSRMKLQGSKQFLPVDGTPVLARTLLSFQKARVIRDIIVAAREEDFEAVKQIKADYGISKLKKLVVGGETRQQSAKNAFAKVGSETRFVAIADGARCLITPQEIDNVCMEAYRNNAASAACRVVDTVKRASVLGNVRETVDRDGLWMVQTPQVFQVSLYAAALARAEADGFEATDDNSLIEHLGFQIRLVECNRWNIKITTPDDLILAEAVLTARKKGSQT